ncbi:MAG: hypothetical protein R2744_05095 [Bacteroidales bacterium]
MFSGTLPTVMAWIICPIMVTPRNITTTGAGNLYLPRIAEIDYKNAGINTSSGSQPPSFE